MHRIFFSFRRALHPTPLLLSVLLLLLLLLIVRAQQSQSSWSKLCSDRSNGSIFGKFHDNLISFLQASVYYYDIGISGFYNATVGEEEGADRVYGLLLCGGDVAPDDCRSCAKAATQNVLQKCPYSKGAIIWYSDCLLRYSNESFFSTVEASPFTCSTNGLNVKMVLPPNSTRVLNDTFQSLAFQAASNDSLYASIHVRMSKFVGLYARAECTRDLFKEGCSNCLQRVLSYVPQCRRQGKPGGILAPSCNVRYELYQLGSEAKSPAPSNSKATRTTDSKFSKLFSKSFELRLGLDSDLKR